MRIDRAYVPVEVLGPGKRLVVWVQGCSKACPGCSNPELWDVNGGQEIPEHALANMLVSMAKRSGVDRITFTGGDPLEQPENFCSLLRQVRPYFYDILVYTGYTVAEVQEVLGKQLFAEFTCLADALIDGPYKEELNNGICALRGSTNQEFHLFNESLRADYKQALAQPRRIQNVAFDGRLLSIGIHQT
jgi:anaerobic ribonucleoside-triphosphate reductase activating protein